MTYRLFSVPGWGSVLTEAMLAVAGLAYTIVDVDGFDRPGPARDRLIAVNPLAQVPTLILPDGAVMTESAAIALLLAENHPEARLAPPPADPARPQFLRRLLWLSASVYPTFTYADYPERWVDHEAETLKARVLAHRESLWRQFERDLPPGGWALGERFSLLDIYIAAMTHWQPRRPWFAAECPNLLAIARRGDDHPVLGPVLLRNFGQSG